MPGRASVTRPVSCSRETTFRKIGKDFHHASAQATQHRGGWRTLLVSEWESISAPSRSTRLRRRSVEALVQRAPIALSPRRMPKFRWGRRASQRPMTDIFKGHDPSNAGASFYQDANVKGDGPWEKYALQVRRPGTPPLRQSTKSFFPYRFDAPDRSFSCSPAIYRLVRRGSLNSPRAPADVLVTEVTSVDDVVGLMKAQTAAWEAKTEPEKTRVHPSTCTRSTCRRRRSARWRRRRAVRDHCDDALRAVQTNPNDDHQRFADDRRAKHFTGSIMVAKDLMQF